jgi:hypothetical protein
VFEGRVLFRNALDRTENRNCRGDRAVTEQEAGAEEPEQDRNAELRRAPGCFAPLDERSERQDQAQYLRVYMAQLRRKIESDPARPKLLITEPGVGYRLRDQL